MTGGHLQENRSLQGFLVFLLDLVVQEIPEVPARKQRNLVTVGECRSVLILTNTRSSPKEEQPLLSRIFDIIIYIWKLPSHV